MKSLKQTALIFVMAFGLALGVFAQNDDEGQKRPPKPKPPVYNPKDKPPRDNPPKGGEKPKKPEKAFYLV